MHVMHDAALVEAYNCAALGKHRRNPRHISKKRSLFCRSKLLTAKQAALI